MTTPFGVTSMVERLDQVLVQRPGRAFGAAFDDRAHGFRHPVDLDVARAEHDAFVELLVELGVTVHELGVDSDYPDLVYQYDPSLMVDTGAVLLRSGKPTRRGEEELQADWYRANGVPIVGCIEPPGTVDGGDVFWLDDGLVAVGRTLRTNATGIAQLAELLSPRIELVAFDVPYDAGPAHCLHLLSLISPLAHDLAVVELARLPVGLHELLGDRGVTLIDADPDEIDTLATNVLAVRPGVLVMVEGNPVTAAALTRAGCEVHTFPGVELCWNGSGGPTCLTRPLHRLAA